MPKGLGLKLMWDILSRSTRTVHTLCFEEKTYFQLYGMRFPHLRSLALGVCICTSPLSSDNFTNFVLARNYPLEELDMEYGHYLLHLLEADTSSLGFTSEPPLIKRKRLGNHFHDSISNE
jgi:hypothetical protein